MIRINLLPQHLRPVKRTPLPYIASGGALIGAVVVMALAYLSLQAEISGKRAEYAEKERDLATLAEVVEQHNELVEQKRSLEGRIATIQEILDDRIIWSEQLHRLASLTPSNFWYRRILETRRTIPETRVRVNDAGEPILDQRTGRPQTDRVNVPRRILEISGYVINDEDGNNYVYPLTERTTTDPNFSARFTLHGVAGVGDLTEFAGFLVRSFTLSYIINSMEAGA